MRDAHEEPTHSDILCANLRKASFINIAASDRPLAPPDPPPLSCARASMRANCIAILVPSLADARKLPSRRGGAGPPKIFRGIEIMK
jgi:hypothetical protein